MCGLSSSPACVHWGCARAALLCSAMSPSILRRAVLSCDAGSSLGAKWFLSLGKQAPSNSSPLRSIRIHFTLTQRKTGNLRRGLGRELSLQVKGLQCVGVCAAGHLSACALGLFTLKKIDYEQKQKLHSIQAMVLMLHRQLHLVLAQGLCGQAWSWSWNWGLNLKCMKSLFRFGKSWWLWKCFLLFLHPCVL